MKSLVLLLLCALAALSPCAAQTFNDPSIQNVIRTTRAITLRSSDTVVLADPTAAAFTVTLAALENGKVITIKNIGGGTNAVTVDPPGATTIDGAATYVLSGANQSVTLIGYASAAVNTWKIVTPGNPAVGYATGAGGAVTQTNIASAGAASPVTLSKRSGQITTLALTTGVGAEEAFVFNNTFLAATDVLVVSTTYAGTGTPAVSVKGQAAGSCTIVITNLHPTAVLNAAVVINFAVIKASAN